MKLLRKPPPRNWSRARRNMNHSTTTSRAGPRKNSSSRVGRFVAGLLGRVAVRLAVRRLELLDQLPIQLLAHQGAEDDGEVQLAPVFRGRLGGQLRRERLELAFDLVLADELHAGHVAVLELLAEQAVVDRRLAAAVGREVQQQEQQQHDEEEPQRGAGEAGPRRGLLLVLRFAWLILHETLSDPCGGTIVGKRSGRDRELYSSSRRFSTAETGSGAFFGRTALKWTPDPLPIALVPGKA